MLHFRESTNEPCRFLRILNMQNRLFGNQMYRGLGYQWASFLLGCLCLLVAPFPYLFFKYGKQLRKRSRYATVKD